MWVKDSKEFSGPPKPKLSTKKEARSMLRIVYQNTSKKLTITSSGATTVGSGKCISIVS